MLTAELARMSWAELQAFKKDMTSKEFIALAAPKTFDNYKRLSSIQLVMRRIAQEEQRRADEDRKGRAR